MTKEEWNLLKQYIDTKIDYEIARREEDEDEYTGNAYAERKALEEAENEINKSIEK